MNSIRYWMDIVCTMQVNSSLLQQFFSTKDTNTRKKETRVRWINMSE